MNEKNIFFYMNNNSFLCRKQLQKYIKKIVQFMELMERKIKHQKWTLETLYKKIWKSQNSCKNNYLMRGIFWKALELMNHGKIILIRIKIKQATTSFKHIIFKLTKLYVETMKKLLNICFCDCR